jgi:hypothetical protein
MLLVLLIEAARAKRKFCCIFDANAPFLLQRFAGERVFDVYKDLLKIFPNQFAQTTGGLPADELLLQRADALSRRRIVSNDRFRQFRDKYPWLANEENHLVKFAVVADKLQVPALNIIVDWDRRISQLGKELIPLLSIA